MRGGQQVLCSGARQLRRSPTLKENLSVFYEKTSHIAAKYSGDKTGLA